MPAYKRKLVPGKERPAPSPPAKSEMGVILKRILKSRDLSRKDLATKLEVTVGYVTFLINGRSKATGRRIDEICDAISATSRERDRLHLAAAIDAGFKVRVPEGY